VTEKGIQLLNGIEAVIFDLDGTLVDSMWVWGAIDEEDFRRHGYQVPEGLQAAIAGMSFTETARYIKKTYPFFTETEEEMKENWNRMAQDAYKTKVMLKPGAYEFLTLLKQRGIRTGVASSNFIGLVEATLEARGVRHMLDSVHTSCEVSQGKPAPDIYLLVAKELGVEPQNCLVFEDIVEGIQAGIRAGMRTCAVADAASAYAWEEKCTLADAFITDYRDLL
jgi:HAD superfamily hydrolase (TIGR01509 family)